MALPKEERAKGAIDEFAHLEAFFDLSYDAAKWMKCETFAMSVRFLRDEHGMLSRASKCLDLRKFAPLTRHQNEHHQDNFEGIKEQLENIME